MLKMEPNEQRKVKLPVDQSSPLLNGRGFCFVMERRGVLKMHLTRIMCWVAMYVLLYMFLWYWQMEASTAWYSAHAVFLGGYIVDGNGGYPDMSFMSGDPIPHEWFWMIVVGVVSAPATVLVIEAWKGIVSWYGSLKSGKWNITKQHVQGAISVLIAIGIVLIGLWWFRTQTSNLSLVQSGPSFYNQATVCL